MAKKKKDGIVCSVMDTLFSGIVNKGVEYLTKKALLSTFKGEVYEL